jgi:hypothetical protein
VIARVCVDDSSDEKQEVAISVGAFVGQFGAWCDVKNRWTRRLKADGLDYFRATEYNGLHGQFFRFRDSVKYPKPLGSQAARRLRDDLKSIILKSKLRGAALVIPLDLYWDIRGSSKEAMQIFTEDPFEIAIQSMIDECVQDAIKERLGVRLEFICDKSSSAPRIEATYRAYKEINPQANEIVASFEHRDDKLFAPLQVADLMAHLGREVYMTKQEPKGIKESVAWVKVWNEEMMLGVLQHEKKRRKL